MAKLQFYLNNCSSRGTVIGQLRLLCSRSREIEIPSVRHNGLDFLLDYQLAGNSLL